MKYLVKFTRTETFVHKEIVEADNWKQAIFKVECGDWEYPDTATTEDNDSTAVEL